MIENKTKTNIFVPNITNKDFRFFQYVIDLRRFKSLYNYSIKKWQYTKYIHFLGHWLIVMIFLYC